MDDKQKAQKKYPFLVSKISPKSNNYCWAPVGKRGCDAKDGVKESCAGTPKCYY